MNSFYVLNCRDFASNWLDGFPLGNGKHASMIWGDTKDIISLNHELLWRGVTRDRDTKKVPDGVLNQVRNLINEQDYFKATVIANAWFGGVGGTSGIHNNIDSYQPAGDLNFELDCENASGGRILDLLNGVATITRKRNNGGDVVLTSYVDACRDVVVCRWYSEDSFSGKISFTRPEDNGANEKCKYSPEKILYSCSFTGGIAYKTAAFIKCNGMAEADETGIFIKDATELIITSEIKVLSEKEDFDYPERYSYDYESMKKTHCDTFSCEMQKFDLTVFCEAPDGFLEERLEKMKKGAEDDGLIMLFYNYGKYLYLSSNFIAELPANLQGKWNYDIEPPWQSDYHFNINLQMNYWMAEPMALVDGVKTMLKFIDKCVPHGKKAADDLYGCRGIWLPLSSDMWGRTTPESYGYGVWLGAAPWFAQHYWQRYLYSGDKDFLRNSAYPFIKEVAGFIEDYVVLENGVYEIYPSQSPENKFVGVGSMPIAICKSSAMDVQLVYDALGYAIKSAEILKVDSEDVKIWKEIRDNLPEFKIGKDGRLLEWNEEFEEHEPGHRHFSHLFGVYPSEIFTEEKRPEQFEAAKKSLEFRMANDGGPTGWSRAWMACLFARFGDGEGVYEQISQLVKQYTTASLLDTHPFGTKNPPYVFQIDGNFGAVAAVNEAIAHFKNNKLYILPALPKNWKNGQVSGFKVPGGHTVDFKWENSEITDFNVTIGYEKELTVVYCGRETVFSGSCGEMIEKSI
ncbi:MAG: glycoside hydrolase N-terminal domain-containing protein [Clostridia bacterium]|nr:glycoside hydrolase N-terminal domain-containing protein [Clostridia bacterium]